MNEATYYKITLSYEIPYNVLDSQEPSVINSRDTLYEKLKDIVPDRYEKFSVKLTLFQLKDTLNFLVTYDSYFRSIEGLPMKEYVTAREIKDQINEEFEEFFNSVNCEYKQINIKTLL